MRELESSTDGAKVALPIHHNWSRHGIEGTRTVVPLMAALSLAGAPTSVRVRAPARLYRICSSILLAIAVFIAVSVGIVLDVPWRGWDE